MVLSSCFLEKYCFVQLLTTRIWLWKAALPCRMGFWAAAPLHLMVWAAAPHSTIWFWAAVPWLNNVLCSCSWTNYGPFQLLLGLIWSHANTPLKYSVGTLQLLPGQMAHEIFEVGVFIQQLLLVPLQVHCRIRIWSNFCRVFQFKFDSHVLVTVCSCKHKWVMALGCCKHQRVMAIGCCKYHGVMTLTCCKYQGALALFAYHVCPLAMGGLPHKIIR